MKLKKEEINYSIGLDIGTNSVGWAVINENYQLIKKGKRNLWGARLFDPAETAQARRLSRSSRRRYNRRRMRIRLLQEMMNEMIMDVDQTFFIRLKNASFLDEEDKASLLQEQYKNNYNLFIENNYTDKNFYDQYPTIYHLRDYLVHTHEKVDPRLIYLALHHIIKYRGNFLYENQNFSSDMHNIKDQFHDLLVQFFDYHQINPIQTDNDKVEANILSILKEKKQRTQRVDECLRMISLDKDYRASYKQFLLALVGLKFDLTKLFGDNALTNEGKNISLCFASEKYEEEKSECESILNDEYDEYLQEMYAVYSWIELQGILNHRGEQSEISISNAMIQRYDKHHNDLKQLKTIIKKYIPSQYNQIFRSKNGKEHNYYQYIHCPSKTKREDFYKFLLKKLLQCPKDNPAVQYCQEEIKKENFLLKQNDRTNGNIPYQLNEIELLKIIENQSIYYPTLKEHAEHIKKLLTYRIPYYIGPLNEKSSFSWIIKRPEFVNEKITPWNLENVVDIDETAHAFIKRMTNYCTYLIDEPVMPKNSLTANMYEVLAELNKIRVNDKLLSVSVKNQIIEQLFMKYRTVTDKQLREWFKKEQIFLNNENLEITGYQKDKAFSSSLRSWIDFHDIFDDIRANYNTIEKIIYDMTIFEDQKILKRRLKKIYGLSDSHIQLLLKKKYKGWSRLSRKLVDQLYADNYISSHCTILDVMKETHMTLMEIINDDKLGFKQLIQDNRPQLNDGKFSYKEVESLGGSPAIKRGIWQSLKIIDEISSYMKHRPSNIFIEFSREEGKKQRTISQVKALKNIYDTLSLENTDYAEASHHLQQENDSNRLSNERLYLYYTQMGHCMYSGQPLDIHKLNLYEVDHIVPQSLIKDDSLDNKVLVIKDENQRKLNDYAISSHIIDRYKDGFWKYLLNNKLISQKKYFNLIRKEYDEKTTEKFIHRQLVETRQIIKNVSQLIVEHYSSTKVMTIRANLISQFREKYHIYKNRNVNDYHHAHDAYIACIIGNFIQKCYPKLEARYLYGEYQKVFKNMEKKHFHDGFLLNAMNNDGFDLETGELVWNASYIGSILKCFEYKDCYITKKLEDNDSSLFNVTIISGKEKTKQGETKASIPVNKARNNIAKYGGYSGLEYEMIAIEGMKKKKIVRLLVGMPLAYRDYPLDKKIEYIEEKESLTHVKILRTIKKNQLIEYKGGLFYMTSFQEIVNAQQLVLNMHFHKIINCINQALISHNYENIKAQDNIEVFHIWLEKLSHFYPLYHNIYEKIKAMESAFITLSVEEQCQVINELLKITVAKPASNKKLHLNDFVLSERINRSQRTLSLDDIQLIENSVTGIYSKKVKL